jgi:hypothetical protein
LLGAAWAVSTVYMVGFFLNVLLTEKLIKGFIKTTLKASMVPLIACAVSAAISIFLQIEVQNIVAILRMVVVIVIYSFAFGSIILVWNRSLILELIHNGFEQ